jgi:hypothetical protein
MPRGLKVLASGGGLTKRCLQGRAMGTYERMLIMKIALINEKVKSRRRLSQSGTAELIERVALSEDSIR